MSLDESKKIVSSSSIEDMEMNYELGCHFTIVATLVVMIDGENARGWMLRLSFSACVCGGWAERTILARFSWAGMLTAKPLDKLLLAKREQILPHEFTIQLI